MGYLDDEKWAAAWTVPKLADAKAAGRKLAMLTAYDASFARVLDRHGVDLVLVGDSLGMVVRGLTSTLAVTVDDIAYHTAAVATGLQRALLIAIAVLALWAVKTRLPHRRRLHQLGIAMIVGILVEAVVGGITVWTGLNPVIVAFHFLATIVLIAIATAMLRGAQDGDDVDERSRTLLVPGLTARLAWLTYAVGLLVLVLGTVVTGSGPHSGDADTPARTGFDPRTVSWIHADVVMLFLGLLIAVLVAVRLARVGASEVAATDVELARLRRSWTSVLHVSLLQGVLGYTQFFTGLPVVLVAAHMLLAALLAVALTNGTLNLYRHPV